MSDVAIKVEDISKLYKIGVKNSNSLGETISSKFKSVFSSKDEKKDLSEFWALKEVSFEIKHGDSVGIIGRNGAGKSTLLKILSRITEPTKGKIMINGRIASLLEVGTGFHPQLTGRENIFLNGSILGMKRKEIQNKFDEIVSFSGVEKFIDTQVKRYSSGMYVRLAFSVAAHLEPEILIVDEVLAVGDAEFQKKCLGKMGEVASQGRTVLFVSHNMGPIRGLCSKGLFMKSGQLNLFGSIDDVVSKYVNEGLNQSNTYVFSDEIFKGIQLKQLHIMGNESKIAEIEIEEKINISLIYEISDPHKLIFITIFIYKEGVCIFRTRDSDLTPQLLEKREIGLYESQFIIPENLLSIGLYTVSVAISEIGIGLVNKMDNIAQFSVVNNKYDLSHSSLSKKGAILSLPTKWSLNKR